MIRPGGVGMSPIAACTVTDFPHPDSPTIASVRPRSSASETPAHRLHDAAVGGELDAQVADLEQAHSTDLIRGSSASRSPSPSRLKASTVTLIAAAGKRNSCG